LIVKSVDLVGLGLTLALTGLPQGVDAQDSFDVRPYRAIDDFPDVGLPYTKPLEY
jgi:hypothetical protein